MPIQHFINDVKGKKQRGMVYMQFRLTNSQRYLVVGLVGLELPLTVTIMVSRVSAMVSARFSVN